MATEQAQTTAQVSTTDTPQAAAQPAQDTSQSQPAQPSGLVEAIQEYEARRHRDAPAEQAKPSPEDGKSAESDTEAKPAEQEKSAQSVESKPAEPAAEEKKPPELAQDAVSAGMARIIRQTRAIDRERRAIAEERKRLAEESSAAQKSREAAERFEAARKKDPVAAVRELLGEETVRGTFPLDLINSLTDSDKEEAGQPTPERLAEIAAEKAAAAVQEKLAEAEKARADAKAKSDAEAKKASDAKEAIARESYFGGLATQFKADQEKYPYLAAKPVDWEGPGSVDEHIRATVKATGRMPTHDQIFAHFNDIREKEAEALAGVYNRVHKIVQPPPKPSPSPAATARVATKDQARDSGGRQETPPAGETMRQRLDRVARELDAQFRG